MKIFTILCEDRNLTFRTDVFSSMLNSFLKPIFLYLVAHFSTFLIKIGYHGRKKSGVTMFKLLYNNYLWTSFDDLL